MSPELSVAGQEDQSNAIASRELGPVYGMLQAWLHDDRSSAGAEEFVEAYAKGVHNCPRGAAVARTQPRRQGSP